MIRVLWFSNGGLPRGKHAATGGWLIGMAEALLATGEVELADAAHRPVGQLTKDVVSGVQEWAMPRTQAEAGRTLPSERMVSDCLRVVDEFQPDMVHIQGTEGHFGLLTADKRVSLPSAISIQGLIHVYTRYNSGELSLRDQLACVGLRDLYLRDTIIQRLAKWRRWAKYERQIISRNRCFIGRTRWDRAHILANNPSADFYHCHEVMRRPFYEADQAARTPAPHSIFVTTGNVPLKGCHLVLRAAGILKSEFPDISVRIAGPAPATGLKGSGYIKWLSKLAASLGLADSVTWVGSQDADGIVRELQRAQVHVTPSFVENGCNALQEAMLVGTPAVVSFAGGMSSVVQDNETALMFQPGDEVVLAECLRQVFLDPDSANTRATNARELALAQNDPAGLAKQMVQIYRDVIEKW